MLSPRIKYVVPFNGRPAAARDLEFLRTRLLVDARTRRLRKADGVVYEPVPGRPCAFRALDTYEKHINNVLTNEAAYNRTPRRFEEMMRFLRKHTELHPDAVVNRTTV
jgi:hypothetical protein